MKCSNCGAPLKVEGNETTVACRYCEASTVLSTPRERPRPSARPAGAPPTRTLMVVALMAMDVEARSAYGRCLAAVYGKATIARFRKIDDKVMHSLKP